MEHLPAFIVAVFGESLSIEISLLTGFLLIVELRRIIRHSTSR